MSRVQKPCALLADMATRKGQKITAKDVAALQLAVQTLATLDAQLTEHFRVYGNTLFDMVVADARSKALTEGMRALLEVHS
jgi:hypothetical protein